MSSDEVGWVDLELELRNVLVDGVDIRGTIEEADVRAVVDGESLGLTIELSDLEGSYQVDAYLVLCDLLFTRQRQGVDEAIGCLVFASEPDPKALVDGLGGMTRSSTPGVSVIPLSRAQAGLLSVACKAGPAFVDDVSQLVRTAAHTSELTPDVAEGLLGDIDELVQLRTRS
jgi:hypothetical protein